jgi:hypothetical protein
VEDAFGFCRFAHFVVPVHDQQKGRDPIAGAKRSGAISESAARSAGATQATAALMCRLVVGCQQSQKLLVAGAEVGEGA